MRSRLEAAVAAWMDSHELSWSYEANAHADTAGQYLHDFRVDGLYRAEDGRARALFVEVKPPRFDGIDVRERMQVIWSSDPDAVLAIWAGGRLQPVAGGFPLAAGAGDGTGSWRRGHAGLCTQCRRLVVGFVDDPARCGCGWEGTPDALAGLDAGAELLDLDVEAALLGSLVANPALRAEVAGTLTPDQFASPIHAAIFETLFGLPGDAGPPDVRVALANSGAVGAAEAVDRLGPALPVRRTEQLASQVRGWATLRALRDVGVEIMELAASGSPAQAEDRVAAAKALLDVFDLPAIKGAATTMEQTLSTLLDELEDSYQRREVRSGVPTGFRDLDELLGGLRPGHLYVIGARPSIGKSAMALGIAAHAAMYAHVPVLFASLEMRSDELTQRLVCAEGRVDGARLRTGRLTEDDWNRISVAVGRLAASPLTLADDFGLTVAGLRRLARDVRRRWGQLGLIVVDYLQLLGARGTAENRQVEVAEMSRGLKVLAGDLEVPVVACSQLSRQLEMRQDKRPVLADLRESGAIENDADVVVFLYRDDIYHRDSPDRGQAEVIVAKHRNGPVGTVRLAFLEQFTRFANLVRPEDLPPERS